MQSDPMRTQTSPPSDPRAYRVNDFCRLYGIGRSGVYKLLKEGKLPSVVIAGRRLIPRDAAEALLRGGEK
jgi:excisionase family DNA binding protein